MMPGYSVGYGLSNVSILGRISAGSGVRTIHLKMDQVASSDPLKNARISAYFNLPWDEPDDDRLEPRTLEFHSEESVDLASFVATTRPVNQLYSSTLSLPIGIHRILTAFHSLSRCKARRSMILAST